MASFTTIQDIAEHLGLSKSTVARALSNAEGVSKKTREKVLLAAESLGYRKHPMLSTWMSHVRGKRSDLRSKLEIAWIDETGQDPKAWAPLHRIFDSTVAHADKLGFHIERYALHGKRMSPKRVRQIIRTRGVAGIIYFLPTTDNWKELLMPEFPGICLAGANMDFGMPLITTSHAENVEIVFKNLYKKGYRRIALSLNFYVLNVRSQSDYGVYLRCCHMHDQQPYVKWYDGSPDQEHLDWVAAEEIDAIIVCDGRFKNLFPSATGRKRPTTALAHLNINKDVADWSGIIEPHEKMGVLALDTLNSQIMAGQTLEDQFSVRMRIPGVWQDGATAPGKA